MRRVFAKPLVCLVLVCLGSVYAPARAADSYNELFGLGTHSEDASIEGWWKLDETSGTTASDATSNARDGTTSGDTLLNQTGPGGAFTQCYSFDGTFDKVLLPSTAWVSGTGARTNLMRVLADSFDTGTSDQNIYGVGGGSTGEGWLIVAEDNAFSLAVFGHRVITPKTTLSTGTWYSLAVTFPTSATDSDDAKIYIDGSNQTLSAESGTAVSVSTTTASTPYIAGKDTNQAHFAGDICDFSAWSRELTAAEVAHWHAGPEPIYSGGGISSPVGTYTVGQTLTAVTDSGNWDTQSNGTLVYAYQWIRADDGTGTNAAEISGATSSTYTLVSGDSGKHIACDILASNDGGSDAAEETRSAYTSQVSGGGGGPAITPITTSIPGSSVDPIRGTIP